VNEGGPRWLLAELTYRCPLRCVYCSNPLDYARIDKELSTEEWLRVFREARELGAVQLGFSGGEPLVRADLEVLVGEARRLGFYTNLITSGIGLSAVRLARLRDAGLDHVQLSFQAATPDINDAIGGAATFSRKLKAARMIKAAGYPMVLNFVLHRQNIEQVERILLLSLELEADYVELANTQYDGWALINRDALLPTAEQLAAAEAVVTKWRETRGASPKIYYVVPDYYGGRPKPCGGGWAKTLLVVAPDGLALPCHGARKIPLPFPNVKNQNLAAIWQESTAFQHFRGEAWMEEPCRSCPERGKDFGGCRCQAMALTGNAASTDPTCAKAPKHYLVQQAVAAIRSTSPPELVRRS